MPPFLNLFLALLGGGALATGASGGRASASEEPAPASLSPAAALKAPQPEADSPPADAPEAPPPAVEKAPLPAGEESDKGVASDAPDLPDSAYDLNWVGLTAQEQYMLELVNRARLDPEAEAERTGDAVDSGVSSTPKQALAVDPILSAAADNHSADMLARDFFAHTNPDGDSPTDRARDEDWDGGGVWENISARWTSAPSVSDEQGWVAASHAGLWESDGHQFGMLQATHTVVGIGVDWGEWAYPGTTFPTAMLVTEKFANDGQTYLTGVVIDDVDGDEFYDIGEGQGGVQITAWTDENVYATSTWDSGGYSLALDAGTYSVRFEGGDLETAFETTVTIGGQNEKLDVFENDLTGVATAMAETKSSVPEEDPVAELFLSADASLYAIERAAQAADDQTEEEPDDTWAFV
ncbi:CAP domain-containing protein [uncultured Roseobacter sp.]|uniref:CAP domain-containing protein n=1 Tax=uncultured Roseobacter sp. TaxID=114847 RepID=UPI0026176E35|nr:CAP domain-containing protein [uncultured Roseobacter sp.]